MKTPVYRQDRTHLSLFPQTNHHPVKTSDSGLCNSTIGYNNSTHQLYLLATMHAPKSNSVALAMPTSTVDTEHWWRHKNLRTLNLLLIFPLLSIFTQG